MKIVLDAMGSDDHPQPEIQAALMACEQLGIEIMLIGKKDILEDPLKSLNKMNLPVQIVHAPHLLSMDDKAVEGARKNPLNSMAVGLDLVKSGVAAAFVTAGNTGGAMFNGLRILGRMKGVLRPALPGIFPVHGGQCVVLDIGANADCRPEFLVQFAILGSVYAEKILNIKKPKIGLVANGEEPGKGNQLVRDTYPLLEKSGLNFYGNVEGKELFGGKVDVAVTDGFTGNVILKTSEAVAKFMTEVLKEGLKSRLTTKIGGLLAKPAFTALKMKMDPSEIGGAPLLGVDGIVIVGHGRSDARALLNAIKVAKQAVEIKLNDSLSKAIQEL